MYINNLYLDFEVMTFHTKNIIFITGQKTGSPNKLVIFAISNNMLEYFSFFLFYVFVF
jgi:hypothetical protein